MFIGRKKELETLNRLYETDKFECVVIYGRRRVGKTALINEFIKDKRCIYFTAVETTARENLAMFSASIYGLNNDQSNESPVFPSFDSLFASIDTLCREEKTVIVIDEYPYLAKSEPAVSSILQKHIDLNYSDNGNIMLILCGSSMSFMENQVLGYQSPLYGRRTSQIKLGPFDYFDMTGFFQRYSKEDQSMVYGMTGGIPKYVLLFDESMTVEKNIKIQFLSPDGYLYEEPENLLKQELREPAFYNSILRLIANGNNRVGTISSAMNVNSSKVIPYIKKLVELGIVDKKTPITEPEGKHTIYYISDSLYSFWYLTIPNCNSLIQQNMSDIAYKKILPSIETYMGKVFEKICMEYMWKHYDEMPMDFTNIGTWWGADPKNKKTEEIDIVATDGDRAIFCECKWRNRLISEDVLYTLLDRSKLVDAKERFYIVFSKIGFTESCQMIAKENNMKLVSFSDM